MCREGLRTHRHLFVGLDPALEVIEAAFELKHTTALVAAVDPANPARIASRDDRPLAYTVALDYLAHLATDPDDRDGARDATDALIHLARYLDTAADVAVRLPHHRLSVQQLAALSEHYEARVELLHEDPVVLPRSLELHRGTQLLRSATWHAHDAHRHCRP